MICACSDESHISPFETSINILEQDTEGNGYKIKGYHVYLYDSIINDADPASFEVLKYEYSKDKKHIYFGTKTFHTADPATFKVLEHGYSKDKDNVYYDYYTGKTIPGADPVTFAVFDLEITKDKNTVYQFYELKEIKRLEKADAKSFIKCGIFYRDKNYLFNCSGDTMLRINQMDEKTINEYTNDQ